MVADSSAPLKRDEEITQTNWTILNAIVTTTWRSDLAFYRIKYTLRYCIEKQKTCSSNQGLDALI